MPPPTFAFFRRPRAFAFAAVAFAALAFASRLSSFAARLSSSPVLIPFRTALALVSKPVALPFCVTPYTAMIATPFKRVTTGRVVVVDFPAVPR